ALHSLEEYQWPGNVRELENVIQRAVALSEEQTVDLSHLPSPLRKAANPGPAAAYGCETPQPPRTYEEEIRCFKRGLVLRALREYGWRKAESARALGVARGYLHRLINQLGIQEPEGEAPVERLDGSSPVGPVM